MDLLFCSFCFWLFNYQIFNFIITVFHGLSTFLAKKANKTRTAVLLYHGFDIFWTQILILMFCKWLSLSVDFFICDFAYSGLVKKTAVYTKKWCLIDLVYIIRCHESVHVSLIIFFWASYWMINALSPLKIKKSKFKLIEQFHLNFPLIESSLYTHTVCSWWSKTKNIWPNDFYSIVFRLKIKIRLLQKMYVRHHHTSNVDNQ